MKAKTYLPAIFSIILLICLITFGNIKTNLENNQFKKIAEKVMEDHYSLYMDKISYDFRLNEGKIFIYITLKRPFLQLSTYEQYSVLDLMHKRIRYTLKTADPINNLFKNDIRIMAETDGNQFQFWITNPNKEKIHYPNGILQTDGKTITLKDWQKHNPNNNPNNRSGTSLKEKEIIEYMERIYHIITNHGVDYNPKKDDKIVVEATMGEFRIDQAEIGRIYRKYYLFYDH
ncbi:hypothetical protein [Bacillus sp. 1P06AnD]|uniref:hypothetical protein n=1 Tax=Bacillus sp. 1P06AnD TaxID=3132208 RepID=UPI0039A0448E